MHHPCPRVSPGFRTLPRATDMDLTYHEKFELGSGPDAYTRLILDVLRGEQATFVRDDELEGVFYHVFNCWWCLSFSHMAVPHVNNMANACIRIHVHAHLFCYEPQRSNYEFMHTNIPIAAWKIFTPVLHHIERSKTRPDPYAFGSRGPARADELMKMYYQRSVDYVWKGRQYGSISRLWLVIRFWRKDSSLCIAELGLGPFSRTLKCTDFHVMCHTNINPYIYIYMLLFMLRNNWVYAIWTCMLFEIFVEVTARYRHRSIIVGEWGCLWVFIFTHIIEYAHFIMVYDCVAHMVDTFK